jgi:predicted transcriptional regulator
MKNRLSVYLDPELTRSLTEYAQRRGKSKSLVAQAAIASFLSPDASERQEAALVRRLDQLVRRTERLERDISITVETIALFIRSWLIATPVLPEQTRAAARVKGMERYDGFVQALGWRLSKGPSFIREVSFDIEFSPYDESPPEREKGSQSGIGPGLNASAATSGRT